jgi:hypothetical protein
MVGALEGDLILFLRKLFSTCGIVEGRFGPRFSLLLAKLLLPVVSKLRLF